jgi:hypothetical protein
LMDHNVQCILYNVGIMYSLRWVEGKIMRVLLI